MTGKEKIIQMVNDGSFASIIRTCPSYFGLKEISEEDCEGYKISCQECWKKALKEEIE